MCMCTAAHCSALCMQHVHGMRMWRYSVLHGRALHCMCTAAHSTGQRTVHSMHAACTVHTARCARYATRRWAEAIRAFRDAEEADPDFPETHFNLAHVLLAAERLEEAGVRGRGRGGGSVRGRGRG